MPLVLIVDDISLERQRVRELVAREGYTFAEAANGLEALALIDQQRPDCILTDLTMPEMDGLQLLGVLQARENHIPVMVLTADRQPETREECRRLGAVAVLHKAWDPQALGQSLHNALHACAGAACAPFTPLAPS